MADSPVVLNVDDAEAPAKFADEQQGKIEMLFAGLHHLAKSSSTRFRADPTNKADLDESLKTLNSFAENLSRAMGDKMKAAWRKVSAELQVCIDSATVGEPLDQALVPVVQAKTAAFLKYGLADTKATGLAGIDTEANCAKHDNWLTKMGNHAERLSKGLL
eukprot:5176623-Pyramimonas_sp.AAC.1